MAGRRGGGEATTATYRIILEMAQSTRFNTLIGMKCNADPAEKIMFIWRHHEPDTAVIGTREIPFGITDVIIQQKASGTSAPRLVAQRIVESALLNATTATKEDAAKLYRVAIQDAIVRWQTEH